MILTLLVAGLTRLSADQSYFIVVYRHAADALLLSIIFFSHAQIGSFEASLRRECKILDRGRYPTIPLITANLLGNTWRAGLHSFPGRRRVFVGVQARASATARAVSGSGNA